MVARQRSRRSGDDVLNNFAVHVSQAEVAARVAIRQLLVVKSKQMQDRGVPIVNVALIFHRLVTVFVRRSVAERCFHPGAGQPAKSCSLCYCGFARRRLERMECGQIRRPK